MTYTYVVMKVSAAAFNEIKQKLADAGYQHAMHEGDREDGLLLDMTHIALSEEK